MISWKVDKFNSRSPGDDVDGAEDRAAEAGEPKRVFEHSVEEGLRTRGFVSDAGHHEVVDDHDADQDEAEDDDPDDVDAGRRVSQFFDVDTHRDVAAELVEFWP